MDISLAKLRQLLTVARCGSFSRAATELNLTQPALSRSIAGIEQRYGFPLFHRLGHGVTPTAAGGQVIAMAEPLLQSMQVFDSNLRQIGSGDAGQLAVGFTPLLASQLLARFAAGVFGPDSQVRLRAMIRPGEQLLSALREDAIELFFFPEGHIVPTDEIEVREIGSVAAVCVVRAAHPLLSRGAIKLDDLTPFAWASSMEASLIPAVPSRARMTCDNYHVLREFVLASDGVFICSRSFVEDDLASGRLRPIEVAGLDLRATMIYLAQLPGRVHSPLALEAIRRVRGLLAAPA